MARRNDVDKYNLEYIVDPILPRRKLHMLAGPSGGGKTTLLFEFLKCWTKGEPVWGFASNPLPWAYIALDRYYDEIGNRCEAAGLNPRDLPIDCLLEKQVTLQDIITKHPEARVLIIEGILLLMQGHVNDYQEVGHFLRYVLNLCEEHDVTIIGTPHATKTKTGEGFTHSRHKVLGSVSWGAYSSTLMFIDNKNPGDPKDPFRKLEILPRVGPAVELEFMFDEVGRLVPTSVIDAGGIQVSPDVEVRLLRCLPLGKEIETAKIVDYGKSLEVSESTVRRYLNQWVDTGIINSPRRGLWLRPANLAH